MICKRITKEPREYAKAAAVAIAAQQLYGRGVRLRPGQNIEYVITDADNRVPNDCVRPYALWEGSRGYGPAKYGEMLREAFEVFAKPALYARGSLPLINGRLIEVSRGGYFSGWI